MSSGKTAMVSRYIDCNARMLSRIMLPLHWLSQWKQHHQHISSYVLLIKWLATDFTTPELDSGLLHREKETQKDRTSKFNHFIL